MRSPILNPTDPMLFLGIESLILAKKDFHIVSVSEKPVLSACFLQ
ncbi:hypothetical protein CHCC20335_4758 [Bacillus paralicheniformis]|nr:hypothetical protein CHCC20335_4758 [Bacillus paralicheniformis]